MTLVLNVEGQVGGLALHQAIHLDAVQIGECECAVFQNRCVHGKGYAVDENMIGIFHFQVKLHLLLVFKVVVEMNRESIILRLYLIDIHSVVGKLALRDFHGRMAATERDFELVQIVETRIVDADAEVAGFVVVGGMVVVAFRVVDFQGVENQVRSIGRNGAVW